MEILDSSRKLAKGALIAFIGIGLGKFISYLYTLIVSRIGKEDYGLLNLGLAVVGFISTLSMVGLGFAILRYIPYYQAKNDKRSIKGILLSSILISLIVSIVFTAIIFVFAPRISINLFNEPKLSPVLIVLSITIIFLSLSDIFIAALTAFKKVEYKVLIKDLGETLVKILSLVLFLTLGYKLSGAIMAYILSTLFTLILSIYVMQKKVFPIFNKSIKPRFMMKEIIFYSLPLIFTEFLITIIKWISTWILGAFRDISEVGIYNVVVPTVSLLVIIPTALMTLFVPLITENYSKSKKDMGKVNSLAIITSHWIFMLNFPIFLFIFVFSKGFLEVLFKPEYAVGALSLSLISIGFMMHSLSHVYNWILIMLKKTKIVFKILLISTIFSVILNYLLIKPYGFLGASIATSLTFIILTLIYMFYSYFQLNLQPIKLNYLKNIFTALISILITYMIPIEITTIFTLIIKFLVYGTIYVFLLHLFKSFEPEDKDVFNLILKKIKYLLKI